MSIAEKITALQTAKSDIATAITAKGGTVASGDGFADFASDIGSIPTVEQYSGVKVSTAGYTDGANVTFIFNDIMQTIDDDHDYYDETPFNDITRIAFYAGNVPIGRAAVVVDDKLVTIEISAI